MKPDKVAAIEPVDVVVLLSSVSAVTLEGLDEAVENDDDEVDRNDDAFGLSGRIRTKPEVVVVEVVDEEVVVLEGDVDDVEEAVEEEEVVVKTLNVGSRGGTGGSF